MLRPHRCVVPFEATSLPTPQRLADTYLRIHAGAKGGRQRFIPISTPARIAAIVYAQQVAAHSDAHLGHSGARLKQTLRRFHYVLAKHGITAKALGITAHGLRHEALIDHYQSLTGAAPPIRGGGALPKEIEGPARAAVAALAGHARVRVSDAYLGRRGHAVINGIAEDDSAQLDNAGNDPMGTDPARQSLDETLQFCIHGTRRV